MTQPTTAMLLERWRERPEYHRLTELALAPSMVEGAAGAAKELQMAIQKLVEHHGPGRRVNELLRKAEEMGLNYDEKAELSSASEIQSPAWGPAAVGGRITPPGGIVVATEWPKSYTYRLGIRKPLDLS